MKVDHPYVSLARTLWSAVADGDAEALKLLFSPDVVWCSVGMNPISGTYDGPDGVVDYLAQVGESVDVLASRLERIYVGEGGAVLEYHVSARRGERTLEMDYLMRLHVRDGLVYHALIVPADQRVNDQFWT